MKRAIGPHNVELQKPDLERENNALRKELHHIKKRERILRKQNNIFNDISDSLREGIAYATLSGKIIAINRTLESILEIPQTKIIGKNAILLASELLDGANSRILIDKLKKVISGKRIRPFKLRYKSKYLEASITLNQKSKKLSGTLRDITDQKRIEERITQKNQDLSKLFMTSLHLLESIDKKTVLQKIVDSAANLVGTDTSAIYIVKSGELELEATCPPIPDNFPAEFRKASLINHPHIKNVIENATVITLPDVTKEELSPQEQLIVSTRNLGSLVYIPLFIDKKVEGVIILGTIQRKHAFEQHELNLFNTFSNIISLALENSYLFQNLRETKEKAEESNRLKTAFLHNVSHEIRTPLNAIIGFSDLLGKDDLAPKLRSEYINIISQSNNQLLSIINDILDISYIEARQITLNSTEVEIGPLLKNLFVQYQTEAVRRNLDFRLINKLNNPRITLITDETKIIGILSNLLNNAFKFTNQGSVEFGCHMAGESLQFFVKDTGIGMPKEEQLRIFERFYQIDNGNEKIYGGMGLGLSICAAYAELLGGKITVESSAGKGSRFTVTIPFEKTVRPHEPVPVPITDIKNSKYKKILVAEDDDTNFAFIKAVLGDYGYYTIRAFNGLDAIQLCKDHPDISLVLMDVRMPLKDGYSSAMEIQKIRPHIPIIFQTAYGLPEDRDHIARSDGAGFLNKPFSKHQLASIVEYTLKEDS